MPTDRDRPTVRLNSDEGNEKDDTGVAAFIVRWLTTLTVAGVATTE